VPISTFLNGRNPTTLRGLLWLALSDSGNVLTASSTSDSGGGATQSWVAGTAIPCRIDPIADRGAARLTGGRIDERSTHVITVPPGTNVAAVNRFAISGRGTFEITATHEQTGEWARVFEVIAAS
jgi:hypothetical protein